jgi:hypothetical protein
VTKFTQMADNGHTGRFIHQEQHAKRP